MIDLKAFVADSPLYYGRLRARVEPSGVAEYGEKAGAGGGFASRPPFPLSALECSDLEAVALWRILAHYGEHGAFNPYMVGRNRKVVGVKPDSGEIVHYMAEDAAECLEWDDCASVPNATASFCEWVRGKTLAVVGAAVEADWLTHEEVCNLTGATKQQLWRMRNSGSVKFRPSGSSFIYCKRSIADVFVASGGDHSW